METDSFALLDILPVLVWRSGRDARCDYFNQAWLEFTGRRLDQELGDGWAEGVHRDDRERCVKDYLEAFEARKPFVLEYRLRHRDGDYRWIRDIGRPYFAASGEFSGYIGGCIDITERKTADERIRKSEAQLRAFMNNSPSAKFIKDVEGHYLYVNPKFLRSFGLNPQDVLFRTDAEIFPPDQAGQFKGNDLRVLAAGAPMEFEETARYADFLHTNIVSKFPIVDAQGQITALGGIAIDITDRKRAEQEIVASREQLRALASRLNTVREQERVAIALNIHDELGQTLTSAKIDVSLLQRAVKSRKRRPSSAHLLRELGSAKRAIDKALDGVRRIAAELRPAVLNELGLGAAIEWLAKDFQKRTRIKCTVAPSRKPPEPDRERSTALYLILQEALTNVGRHASAKTVEIELKEDGGDYVLQVRDDGVGIPDQRLRDWQSLGLSGMQERALRFEGHLVIERGPRGGTRVTANIPRKAEPAAAA